jgi:hypothetical protein
MGMSFPLVRIRAILPRYRTARSQQLDNTTQNTRERPLSGERTRHYPLPMRTTLAEVAGDLAPRLRLCRLLARFLKTQPDLQIPAHRSRRQRKTLVLGQPGRRSTFPFFHSIFILPRSRNNTLLSVTPMLDFAVFTSSHLRPGVSGSAPHVLMSAAQPSTSLPSLYFQSDTTIKFCNSPVLITIRIAGGVRTPSPFLASTPANLRLCFQSLARCSSRNSFPFKLLHCCPGVDGSPFRSMGVSVTRSQSQPHPPEPKAGLLELDPLLPSPPPSLLPNLSLSFLPLMT